MGGECADELRFSKDVYKRRDGETQSRLNALRLAMPCEDNVQGD